MEEKAIQEAKFEVGGKFFWLSRVSMGQWNLIVKQIKHFKWGENAELDIPGTIQLLGEEFPTVVACALVPDGMSRDQHVKEMEKLGALATRGQWLKNEMFPDVLTEVISSFFDFNTAAEILGVVHLLVGVGEIYSIRTSMPSSLSSVA
jgi:hypothetical protein